MTAPAKKTPWSDSRQRSEQVLVRFTPDEMADLTRLAESTGQSKQTLIRAALVHLTLLESVDV